MRRIPTSSPVRRTRPRLRAAGAAAALVLGGCTGHLNTSDQLLDAPPLPALLAPGADGSDPDVVPASYATPSLSAANGLDRRGWPVEVVSSPSRQVEVQPTYVTTLLPDRSLPRDRGEFPRGGSALDTQGDGGAAALEGAANLFGSPFFIVTAPVEMVGGRWWWITERDDPDYERVPPPSGRDPWRWVTPPPVAAAAPNPNPNPNPAPAPAPAPAESSGAAPSAAPPASPR